MKTVLATWKRAAFQPFATSRCNQALRAGSMLILIAVCLTGCAQDLTHPPVYRGQYYAFDVYPHGYNGYPGFPYYGAPFGYGGPAFAITQQQQTIEDNSKEPRTTRTSFTRARHSRAARSHATSATRP